MLRDSGQDCPMMTRAGEMRRRQALSIFAVTLLAAMALFVLLWPR
jgi:hypothetical protein